MKLASPPRAVAVALAASLVAVPAAAGTDADAPLPEIATPAPTGSWTAQLLLPTTAHAAPGGRVLMRLRNHTGWSESEAVFLATESRVVNGIGWVRVILPKRPNGTQGWVRADLLTLRKTTRWVRISTSRRTVTVLNGGKRRALFRSAVGAGRTPTPHGLFAVLDSVPVHGQLSPHVLVLTAHSNVLRTFMGGTGIVGIHGWPTSSVLGQAVSNGCIRMTRSDIGLLRRLAPVGTPVQIGP